jgi:hypothetical protein
MPRSWRFVLCAHCRFPLIRFFLPLVHSVHAGLIVKLVHFVKLMGFFISKRVIARELLPLAVANLRPLRLEISERGWVVEASGDRSAERPASATASRSCHSRYRRKLQDYRTCRCKAQSGDVAFAMQVARWRCRNARCPSKIFTERVPALAVPWARRTDYSREVVRLIGHGVECDRGRDCYPG